MPIYKPTHKAVIYKKVMAILKSILYTLFVMTLNLPNTKGAKIHYLKRINQAHLYEIDLNIKKTLKREQINLPFKGV